MTPLTFWELIADMNRFYASSFGVLMNNIQLALTSYRSAEQHGAPCSEESDRAFFKRILDQSYPCLEELHVSSVIKNQIGRLKDNIDSKPIGEIAVVLQEIQRNIVDEFAENYYLQLDPSERQFYEHSSPLFGSEVANQFPSLAYEIDEAGKCLALQRSTAAAFHLLRCLEGCFAAVWRYMGVPDPIKTYERNWSIRLKRVKKQYEKRWPESKDKMDSEAVFIDEIIGTLSGMQNPYRNSTMHLDSVYTQEDAYNLLVMVKGIIKSLATRMNENGDQIT